MKPKDGITAKCPHFVSRWDWRGLSWTECRKGRKDYNSRQERDADYRATCCDNPASCPFNKAGGNNHE